MTNEHPLLQTVGSGELLAERWIASCRDLGSTNELEPAAAAEFLRAMAGTMTRAADQRATPVPPPEADPSLLAAARAFAWSAGSTVAAVEQLLALRTAFDMLLADRIQGPLMAVIHRLIDQVVVSIVRETVGDLERDALLDPLTGLFNRRALDRNLDLEIGRASRQDRPFTMVFLDVDHLKQVNDSLGHAAGDALLLDVANVLRAVLRQADSAYRVGGDEFVVLLPETPAEGTAAVVERLNADGAPACTWGSASYPEDATTADTLLGAADQQLLRRRRERRTGSAPNDIGCQS